MRYALLSLLFLVFFSWYLYPLAVVDYYAWRSRGFKGHESNIVAFKSALEADDLGLDEIPKLLIGIISGGGFSLLLLDRRGGRKAPDAIAVILLGFVLASAFASLITYHVLVQRTAAINNEYGAETANVFINIAVSRFRELWVLISALASFGIVHIRRERHKQPGEIQE